ncbi:MAG: DUF6264 family protein [Microbacterium sp.]|uniref:DUF6264 family protein n=1 Tax=Microbacterium sp. TaxID=51671 RepID=UPI0039E5635A
MSDPVPERPRPQYGEYATPEEQAARIRQPAPASSPPVPPIDPVPAPPTASAAVPSPGRMIDRIFTFGLLGYGLFNVLTTIPTIADYGTFAANLLSTLGVDASLADPSAGRGWGVAASLVLGIGWVAAAAASWLNLRARRISFWIPLAAGVLCNMISSLLLLVPLIGDPTVWAALEQAFIGS